MAASHISRLKAGHRMLPCAARRGLLKGKIVEGTQVPLAHRQGAIFALRGPRSTRASGRQLHSMGALREHSDGSHVDAGAGYRALGHPRHRVGNLELQPAQLPLPLAPGLLVRLLEADAAVAAVRARGGLMMRPCRGRAVMRVRVSPHRERGDPRALGACARRVPQRGLGTWRWLVLQIRVQLLELDAWAQRVGRELVQCRHLVPLRAQLKTREMPMSPTRRAVARGRGPLQLHVPDQPLAPSAALFRSSFSSVLPPAPLPRLVLFWVPAMVRFVVDSSRFFKKRRS